MIRRQRTTLYITSDGRKFCDQAEAIAHEKVTLLAGEIEKYLKACREMGVEPSSEEAARYALASSDLIIALRGTKLTTPTQGVLL